MATAPPGGPLRVVGWNPQSMGRERSDDVRIVLAGTQRRSEAPVPERHPHHRGFHFGWCRSEHVNRSCGVSILLSARRFGARSVRRILDVPKALRGRVAGILVSQAWLRLAVIGMYFPPRQAGEAGVRQRRTIDLMTKWLALTLAAVLHRYLPLVSFDLNDSFAPFLPWVGEFAEGVSHYAAEAMLPVLQAHQLALANTHRPVGATWFGLRGEERQLDFVAVPVTLLGAPESVVGMHHSARRLQLHHSGRKWDHVPVQVKLGLFAECWNHPQSVGARIAMSLALQRGHGRAVYLEERLSGTLQVDEAPEELHDRIMQAMRSSAEEAFAKSPVYTEDHKEMTEDVRRLLRRRRELRDGLFEANTFDMLYEVQWELVRLSRHLKARRTAYAAELGVIREDAFMQASKRRDFATIHRIARLIAGRGRGPRGRCYRVVVPHAEVQEWVSRMKEDGPRGGCRAVEADGDVPGVECPTDRASGGGRHCRCEAGRAYDGVA